MPLFPQDTVYKQNMTALKQMFKMKRRLVLPEPRPVNLFRRPAPPPGSIPANPSAAPSAPVAPPAAATPAAAAPAVAPAAPVVPGPGGVPAAAALDFVADPAMTMLLVGVIGLSVWSPESELMSIVVVVGGMAFALMQAASYTVPPAPGTI